MFDRFESSDGRPARGTRCDAALFFGDVDILRCQYPHPKSSIMAAPHVSNMPFCAMLVRWGVGVVVHFVAMWKDLKMLRDAVTS
jgi:hypothetical protein